MVPFKDYLRNYYELFYERDQEDRSGYPFGPDNILFAFVTLGIVLIVLLMIVTLLLVLWQSVAGRAALAYFVLLVLAILLFACVCHRDQKVKRAFERLNRAPFLIYSLCVIAGLGFIFFLAIFNGLEPSVNAAAEMIPRTLASVNVYPYANVIAVVATGLGLYVVAASVVDPGEFGSARLRTITRAYVLALGLASIACMLEIIWSPGSWPAITLAGFVVVWIAFAVSQRFTDDAWHKVAHREITVLLVCLPGLAGIYYLIAPVSGLDSRVSQIVPFDWVKAAIMPAMVLLILCYGIFAAAKQFDEGRRAGGNRMEHAVVEAYVPRDLPVNSRITSAPAGKPDKVDYALVGHWILMLVIFFVAPFIVLVTVVRLFETFGWLSLLVPAALAMSLITYALFFYRGYRRLPMRARVKIVSGWVRLVVLVFFYFVISLPLLPLAIIEILYKTTPRKK